MLCCNNSWLSYLIRRCPVAVPDKFDCNQAMFPAFLEQCQLFISLRAEDFPTDWSKVGFVISLLSGSAARWATPLLVKDSALLNDFRGFCEHLKVMYEDPIKTHTAACHLKDLQQGQQSLQEYVSEFRLLSQDSVWNEAALMDTFQDGLVDELQDELAQVDCPATLNELIHLCLRIDAHLQRRNHCCASRAPPVVPVVRETSFPQEEPMDLGAARPHLSVMERKRRCVEGLCLYCREPGHLAASCPKKQQGVSAPRPAPWTQQTQSVPVPAPRTRKSLPWIRRAQDLNHIPQMWNPGPPRHLILVAQVFLANSSQGIPVHALVDSGTTTNFMDVAFAEKYAIPQCSVDPPLLVVTIDGQVLVSGPNKAATKPLCLTISTHEEAIQFYLTSGLHLPLVLGLAWLRTHDPQIYWSQNMIMFLSLQCMDHTHHICAGQVMSPPKMSMPSELQDFADCWTRPFPWAVMSDLELAALWDFFDKNLACGFIRPSSLPLSAPVLFIKKKTDDLHLWCDYHQLNTITLEKCQFFQSTIKFLGHCISLEDISMEPVKDVQRLLGFANYYWTFIPGFVSLTESLTWLLQKKVPFQWGVSEQQSFQALKQAFMTEPILKHANPHRLFIVEMDASDVVVGAVLLQAQAPGGTLFPCAYFSRKLNPAEQVWTDHKNLEHLKTAQKLNQRQIWWFLFFAWFNFHVTYVPSGHNQWADALSQKPEYLCPEDQIPLRTVLPVESFSAVQEPVDLQAQIQGAQWHDAWVDQRRQEVGPNSPWLFEEELLHYRDKLYVPAGPLQGLILLQCHDNPEAKSVTRASPGLLQPLPTPERPWGALSMDFLTDLPPLSGFTTVFVVVDMLTKMAHFIPCWGLPTARATAHMFVQHIFWLHGLPDWVVLDRGTLFTTQFWKGLMTALGIQICLSSSHHPEIDGRTEKVIGILEQYLCCFVNQQQDNWADYLAVVEFAFNNSQHTSTQTTPFLANVGYYPRFFALTPLDSPVPEAKDFLSELQAVHQLVQQYLEKAKADYKEVADCSQRVTLPLAVGDRVWLSTWHLPLDWPVRKLDHRYLGPFPIEAVINPVAHNLKLPHLLQVHPVFHRYLLVPEQLACLLRQPDPSPPAPRDEDSSSGYSRLSVIERAISLSTLNSHFGYIHTVRPGGRVLRDDSDEGPGPSREWTAAFRDCGGWQQ
ncbi:Retrotransposon-derived protein PEG10, partial [Ophiophagus hannah]